MSATTEMAHRPLRRLVTIAARIVLVLSFLLLAALGLGPRTGRYQVMTVLTGSMTPTIPAGSLVVVRPVDPANLRVGDVITYRIPVQDRRVVTHRVVELIQSGTAPTVRTKGDALEESDPWTTRFAGEPVWRVQASVPIVGATLRAMQRPVVRQATVLVAPALLALALVASIWRSSRRDDETAGVPFDGIIVIAPGYIRLPGPDATATAAVAR